MVGCCPSVPGGLELFEIPMAVMEDGQFKEHCLATTASGEVQADDHDAMLAAAVSGAMGHPSLAASAGDEEEAESIHAEAEAAEPEVEEELMTQEDSDGIWHQVAIC